MERKRQVHIWVSIEIVLVGSCLCCSYFRTEILGGFINGLFLFFVAFFIFAEAVEVSK